MSSIVTPFTSRPPRVWFHQRAGEPLPFARPKSRLDSSIRQTDSRTTSRTHYINRRQLQNHRFRLPTPLRSGLPSPFNTHRTGIVERFSPIHF